MPKYNEFYYQNGYYGIRSALAYSAEPITATALDYRTVLVEFLTPTGTYSDFRLVRSQLGIPQTQEDGAVVYSSVGPPSNTAFEDTTTVSTHPLIAGRFVFYRAWVRKTESSYWVPAGDAYTLLPSPHSLGVGRDAVYSGAAPDGYSTDDVLLYSDTRVDPFVSTTHERFMAMLPRVLTTATNSGIDTINDEYNKDAHDTGLKDNSLISTFLSAFSFTFDEFLTFASLITPDTAVHWASPTSVYLGSHLLGMTLDIEAVTSTQRRLLRNAMDIYHQKGTAPGLELLVQSMTAYDAVIEDTVNLLPAIGDATFNLVNWVEGDPVGNWAVTSSDIVIAPYTDGVVLKNDVIKKTLDETYCLRVKAETPGKGMVLGTADPVKTAIPVSAGTQYSASLFYKEETLSDGSETIGAEFIWYDRFGQTILIDEDFFYDALNTNSAVGESWTRYHTGTHTAPVGAVYASLGVYFSSTDIVYVDMVQFQQGAFSDYQEPRGVIITLNPSKKNLIKNPTFISSVEYWDKSGSTVAITQSNQDSRSLTGCLKAEVTQEPATVLYSQYIDVTPGLYYSASAYIKDVNAFQDWSVNIEWSTGPETEPQFQGGNPLAVNQDTWTRVSFSAKAPAGFTKARVWFTSNNDPDRTYEGTRFVLFDSAQFEQAYTPTDYFDGYLTDDGGEWEGMQNKSFSVNYPSKSVRIDRLRNEIQNYIGFDTPYYVETAEGKQIYGIS